MKKLLLHFTLFIMAFLESFLVQGQDYEIYFKKAERLYKKKEYNDALKYYTNALDIRNTFLAYYGRGLSYYQLKNVNEFCNDFEQASNFNISGTLTKKNYLDNCFKKDTFINNEHELILKRTKLSDTISDFLAINKISNDTTIYFVKSDIKIYTKLNSIPNYPGGLNSLMEFLVNNVEYPIDAQIKGFRGMVIAHVTIDTKGNIYEFDIAKKSYSSLNDATLDVIKKIDKKFIPANINDTPVYFRLNIPLVSELI